MSPVAKASTVCSYSSVRVGHYGVLTQPYGHYMVDLCTNFVICPSIALTSLGIIIILKIEFLRQDHILSMKKNLRTGKTISGEGVVSLRFSP